MYTVGVLFAFLINSCITDYIHSGGIICILFKIHASQIVEHNMYTVGKFFAFFLKFMITDCWAYYVYTDAYCFKCKIVFHTLFSFSPYFAKLTFSLSHLAI
ncbi:hypothetical protein CHS0354_009512 [Potamilus streckersoni]|uniref:Uncharacterized protein n=1 Tax=Potamilus streckersoni TaxID=2493646 RepID=A0AAE0RWF6_9BIVA|nr:hypothetical protein CHS0354_009512 [Potamilus streckersoni]